MVKSTMVKSWRVLVGALVGVAILNLLYSMQFSDLGGGTKETIHTSHPLANTQGFNKIGHADSSNMYGRKPCLDDNENCAGWTIDHKCLRNPSFMFKICPVGCSTNVFHEFKSGNQMNTAW